MFKLLAKDMFRKYPFASEHQHYHERYAKGKDVHLGNENVVILVAEMVEKPDNHQENMLYNHHEV